MGHFTLITLCGELCMKGWSLEMRKKKKKGEEGLVKLIDAQGVVDGREHTHIVRVLDTLIIL